MAQVKRCLLAAEASLVVGRVRLASAGDYFIENEAAVYQGRRAASCLMEVAPGDMVLAVVNGPQAWVVEVLERSGQGRLTLRCDEGLELAAGEAGVRISGGRIDLAASREIRTASPAWTLETETAQVRAGSLNVVSRAVNGVLGRLRLAAAVAESTVGRLVQRARTALRAVEGLDRQRAGKLRVEVDEDWTLHAADAQLRAQEKIRMDAKKIDLG